MCAFPRQLAFAILALVSLFAFNAVAPAQSKSAGPVPLGGVEDNAGLFSADAVRKAKEEIDAIKKKTGKDFVVQTVEHPPFRYKDAKSVRDYEDEWGAENFKNYRINGVYVLICEQPRILQVRVGDATRSSGSFTNEDRSALREIVQKKLSESTNEAQKGEAEKKKAAELRDAALLEAVAYVKNNMTAPASARKSGTSPAAPARDAGQSGILGWVCVGLVVVLIVWLVIGIVRALSGGSAAPGMAGGGGGFFSGLLGGLFGAMAGMWIYNSFFGGGMSSASAGGYDPGTGDAPSDIGGGSSGETTDWSSDAGGDAGGGDWGGGDTGGGDAGGGGDWGGGGGDWGGGGGDWGGGGGDW